MNLTHPWAVVFAVLAFIFPIVLFATGILLHRRIVQERQKKASMTRIPGLDPPSKTRDPALLWPASLATPAPSHHSKASNTSAAHLDDVVIINRRSTANMERSKHRNSVSGGSGGSSTAGNASSRNKSRTSNSSGSESVHGETPTSMSTLSSHFVSEAPYYHSCVNSFGTGQSADAAAEELLEQKQSAGLQQQQHQEQRGQQQQEWLHSNAAGDLQQQSDLQNRRDQIAAAAAAAAFGTAAEPAERKTQLSIRIVTAAECAAEQQQQHGRQQQQEQQWQQQQPQQQPQKQQQQQHAGLHGSGRSSSMHSTSKLGLGIV